MSHIINFTREEIPSDLMTLKEIELNTGLNISSKN